MVVGLIYREPANDIFDLPRRQRLVDGYVGHDSVPDGRASRRIPVSVKLGGFLQHELDPDVEGVDLLSQRLE